MNKYLHSTIILRHVSFLTVYITNIDPTYSQYKGIAPDTVESTTPAKYKVPPYYNLFIRAVTPDPQRSEMFNALSTTAYSDTITEQSADLISYPVDSFGAIHIPHAGRVQVAGKSHQNIAADVEKALQEYISNAAVSVKLINNYVSLLGEVNRPGRDPVYKDSLNIFQALAMGSELGDYNNRQQIQIIRQTAGRNVVKEFTLTDSSILSSKFFYVLPSEVIYAKPIKGEFFQRMHSHMLLLSVR